MADGLTFEDCISGPERCAGEVHFRMALSGSGEPFIRCDKHWGDRLDVEERLRRDYPDSPTPPDWFDPLDAGERWNDDY
jgi:hypothetical protein